MDTVTNIAKYILGFFQERGDPITNLKLQKLLYYVEGWHLALYDQPAFKENLEAWVHGPAQPEVYRQYKKYRWEPIGEEMDIPKLDKHLKEHIDEVLSVYGTDTAYALERRSHLEDPWRIARDGLPPDEESHAIITRESMKNFFKKQIASE